MLREMKRKAEKGKNRELLFLENPQKTSARTKE